MATNKETGEYEEDFTPKTAKRKISKTMIIVAAIVILLAGLGIAGYFIYEGYFLLPDGQCQGGHDYLPAYRKRKWKTDKYGRLSRR